MCSEKSPLSRRRIPAKKDEYLYAKPYKNRAKNYTHFSFINLTGQEGHFSEQYDISQ